MSLVHGMPLDAGFVLSRNFDSLFNPKVAAGLGVDMALFERHIERIAELGYRPVTGRSSLTWTISRLLLWRGDPDITAITYDDVVAFGEEIRRYCALPEAGFIRASHVSNARRREPLDKLTAQHEKACRTRMFVLHVLLFDIGQVSQEPRYGLVKDVIWKQELTPPGTPAAIAAPIDRWLSRLLQTTDRSESVRHARDAFRYLLRWLSDAHPEIVSLTELTRDHVEGYLGTCTTTSTPATGSRWPPGAATSTSARCCSSPGRPASGAGRCSLTPAAEPVRPAEIPSRLPRFIPRQELDRLMKAIEELQDPYQRAALLLVRWSGARRGEISRLTVDCLDAYSDGYPRLRIPVGKTYTERMIPLHPQAADALRDLIGHARTVGAAARYDTWAHQNVRWVFMHRGQPLGKHYLFDEPLEIACHQAGLIDAGGRPTVSAHRFRHTVGTQLAEGGAQIQTIMAILGHRSATMSATYSHISDPVLKEHYEKVIAAGGRVAGPAAETLLTNQLGTPWTG